MSLGVVIVGLGQIGMGYDLELDANQYIYSHARAFSLHPSFHLVAAVDPDAKQREIFTQTFHAPAYATAEAAFSSHQPQLVVIATPTPLHKETLQAVLTHAKPVAVLCEKPLAYSVAEGQWMVDACARAGIKLYVNYMRRSTPGFIDIKKRLDSGEIQTPVKGVVWYSKGFLHNGSHFVNLMEYLLGAMQSATLINKGRTWNQNDSEPDVSIKFEKGEVVFLAAWEEKFSHYTVELLSPNGRLMCASGGETIEWQPAQTDGIGMHSSLSGSPEVIASGMSRYQWHVAEQLAESLRMSSAKICSGKQGLDTLKLADYVLHQSAN
jgi:predicted dehydrogenase